jgi:hypothetical protein
MRKIALVILFLSIMGCSTEPVQTGAIALEFSYKQLRLTADSLYPVFPNPFTLASGDTGLCIQFAVADSTDAAELLVQNALGDPIAEFSDSALSPGIYTGWWNPISANGSALVSGIYFVTLQNGAFIYSRLVDLQEND